MTIFFLLVQTLQEVQCDYFFSHLGSDLRRLKGCWGQQNLGELMMST